MSRNNAVVEGAAAAATVATRNSGQGKRHDHRQFSYEIMPTNFFSLPDEKQETMLTRFAQLLNASAGDGPITLTLATAEVEFEGIRYSNIRTYITGHEALAGYLAPLGFVAKEVDSAPSLDVVTEHARSVLAEYKTFSDAHGAPDAGVTTGRPCRLFVLTSLRPRMPAAWIHSLLQHCDLVKVRVKKIDPDQAVVMAQKYKTTIEAVAARRQSLVPKLERAEAVYQALRAQRTALFYTSVSCAMLAGTEKELDARSQAFVKAMKAAELRFSDVPFLQRRIATGEWRKDLILELGSLAVVYPFVSADLLEVEKGIMLGQNMETGSPVVFDYRMRSNYNMILLASSGAGKSVTAKTILKRTIERFPDAHVYVVDPQGEYEKIADYFGLSVAKLTDSNGKVRRMGLDPYALFEPLDVPQVISDIAGADDLARKEITARSMSASSIFDLYGKVDDHAKRHLVQLVEGPFAELFRAGEKVEASGPDTAVLSKKAIISLQGAYDNRERQAVLLTLVLAKAWKYIISAPAHVPKVLIVDEGWLVFKIPATARFVEMIARTGRKLNVLFLFISQRPEDVIRQETGRAILENADTKILLRNTEIASQEVADALWLSQREREMLPLLANGEALMFAGEHRLRVRMIPQSDEELEVFSTTPDDASSNKSRR